MKRIILTASMVLIAAGIIYFQHLYNKRFYLEEFPYTEEYSGPIRDKIVILGDSWVSNDKLGPVMRCDTKKIVHSAGYPGAISRDLIAPLDSILKTRPKYVVIVCGVNDHAQKVGAGFYAYHMRLMYAMCIAQRTAPIILEMPTYFPDEIDVPLKNMIVRESMGVFRDDTIKEYREGISDFTFKSLSFPKEMYKDPAHLDQSASNILAGYLAETVMDIELDLNLIEYENETFLRPANYNYINSSVMPRR